jgi:pyruvate/2-oxoacid:ferredoxin oxidoreductase alpha subunit
MMRNKERVMTELDNQLRLIKSVIKGLNGKDLTVQEVIKRIEQIQNINEFIITQVQTE